MAAVVISERWDRKAAKYGTPAVPYPFDSRATYDRSLRQPLGRDFNTDEAFRFAPWQLPADIVLRCFQHRLRA